MAIADKINQLIQDKRDGIQALKYRGSDISKAAGFQQIAEGIITLPPSNSISTIVDDTTSLTKNVPANSTKYCYLKSLGGMTYKCNNLIPFPYYANRGVGEYTQSGVTFTIGEDRVVNLTGTGTAIVEFTLFQGFLPAGTYTMSGINASNDTAYYMQMRDKDSGNWHKNAATIDGDANRGTFTITAEEANQYYCRLNIRVVSGVAFTNVKVRPMLNAGTTALPYEDYYEGLKDTKPTAIKVSGANLLDFEAALAYWKMSYTKDGDSFTISHSFGAGYNKPYKFTDNAQVCTISVSSSSTTYTSEVRLWFGVLKDGKFTRAGSTYFKVGENTTFTSSSAANAIMFDYGSGSGAITTTIDKIRINYGSTDCGYQPYHEPATYLIPESLQGTGKGVEGASDTMDFEDGKLIIKTKTIALSDVGGYQMLSLGGSENPYVSDDGLVSIYTYNLKDYLETLRTKALCNVLPFTNDWSGKTFGFILPSGATKYVKVSIKAADAGVNTSDEYNPIVNKIVQWLKDNNATLTYAVVEPTETNIDTSTFDPLIEVESGGSIEFITDSGKAPNSTIIYQTLV